MSRSLCPLCSQLGDIHGSDRVPPVLPALSLGRMALVQGERPNSRSPTTCADVQPAITPKPLQSRAETTRGDTRSGDSARSPVSREGNVAVNTRQPGAGPDRGENRLWAKLERERGGLVEEANTYPSAIPGTSAPAPIRHFQLFWDTEPLSRVTWWLSGVCWRCSGSRFCAKGVKTLWGH